MHIEIRYIFHNCFIIKFPTHPPARATFLFDYPGPEFVTPTILETVASDIEGTDLYVFGSHFHPDHFNRDIALLGAKAQRARFLLSKDIVKKNPGFKNNPTCLIMNPDQTYPLDEMTVTTFRSNDEGVAFLIQTKDLAIYHGGDLANWAWEDNTPRERQWLETYFGEVLQRLQALIPADGPLQIAFSNTDVRVKNWAGAAQFIETLKPRLFVPMHTFGKTEPLARFIAEHPQIGTPIFQYQKTGDRIILEV